MSWHGFALANRAAVPPAGQAIDGYGFGTLHQAVALTGPRKLFVRFVAPGGNIRDAKTAGFDVVKLLADLRRVAGAKKDG